MDKVRGVLIAIEGGEGVGKTTQTQMLQDFLQEQNLSVLVTNEPGGSIVAELVKDALYASWRQTQESIDIKSEALLFYASRRQHILHTIAPALQEGKVVICDRYVLSSKVYQRACGEEMLSMLDKHCIDNYLPDLQIILDAPPEHTMRRLRDRAVKFDKHDSANIQFHNEIRESYLQWDSPERNIFVIDSSLSKKDTFNKVCRVVTDFLTNKQLLNHL